MISLSKIAYLTIDDGPTKNTKRYVGFLNSKNITAIMFFVGNKVSQHEDAAIYAAQNGMILGNHSYSHPHFSQISIQDCYKEILKQEEVLNRIYEKANVKREHKIFRFCYGDKGGNNKQLLQMFLKEEGFVGFEGGNISYPWYRESLNEEIDIFWTFDYKDYQLAKEQITFDEIIKCMYGTNPIMGGHLSNDDSENIILIHDDPLTEKFKMGYFETLVDETLKMGIEIRVPKFTGMY